jgi:peptidoglycan hydrolase CwlO-like protein
MATTVPDPSQQPRSAPPQPKKGHTLLWIVLCVVLVLVSAGLLIWALGLQSDLDDQKAKSAQLEQQASATQDDVKAVSDQVDSLSQSIKSAADSLAQSTDEASQNAQSAISGLQDSIDSLNDRLKTARGKLSDAINKARGDSGDSGG